MINVRRRKGIFAATLLATTVIAGGGFAWAQAGGATAPLGLAPVVNQAGFADLAAKVGPAVVNIATTEGGTETAQQGSPNFQGQMPFPPNSPMGQMFRHFFDGQQGGGGMRARQALGSGFIIDPAGYIVTNNHVVDHAHDVKVTMTDGHSYPAKI